MDLMALEFPSRRDLLDFGPRDPRGEPCPSYEPFPRPPTYEMVHHNKSLREEDAVRLEKVQNNHPVVSSTLLWAEISEIDRWFTHAEQSLAVQWTSLDDHPVAKAQYLAWRDYLGRLATTRARAVFVFS